MDKIQLANQAAADAIINADPVWEDVKPAGEVLEGMDDYTVTHSGPPIAYEDMVRLHQRGMVSACLFEGWAKTEAEALKLIESGKLKIRRKIPPGMWALCVPGCSSCCGRTWVCSA